MSADFRFEEEPIIRRHSSRGRSGMLPLLFLLLALTLAAVAAGGWLWVQKSRPVQEMDERYEQLHQRALLLSRQLQVHFRQFSQAKEARARDRLYGEASGEITELEIISDEMEAILRDRMAISGVRPGDHGELRRAEERRQELRSMRSNLQFLWRAADSLDRLSQQTAQDGD